MSPTFLPPYMRKSPKVAEVLPILHWCGLSTNDFRPALESLIGEEAGGLLLAGLVGAGILLWRRRKQKPNGPLPHA